MLTKNGTLRSSLKRPNFPGADRLRFAGSSLDPAHDVTNETGTSTMSRKRNPKRQPNLPIGRLTSRVLNNTNLELNADFVEPYLRGDVDDTGRLNQHCRNYVIGGVTSPAGRSGSAHSDSNEVIDSRPTSGSVSPAFSTDSSLDTVDSGPSEDTSF